MNQGSLQTLPNIIFSSFLYPLAVSPHSRNPISARAFACVQPSASVLLHTRHWVISSSK